MSTNNNYIFSSIKGIKHKENWDNFLVIDELMYSIFAVFDGVSSAAHGKEAALKAKNFIKEHYKTYIDSTPNIRKLMYDLNQNLIGTGLTELYSTYCIVYFDKKSESYDYSWLGDSRIYIISSQFAEQLTFDDSYSDHVITKFLGNTDLEWNDFRQIENRKKDDHILLCTDGFYRLFESNKMEFFINFHKAPLSIMKEKINSLVKGKNSDDSTFIFVK
jgi:serine/threonine protein phosphatase PrpC